MSDVIYYLLYPNFQNVLLHPYENVNKMMYFYVKLNALIESLT